MKVIILTSSIDEGREYARLAGLALQDVLIPGSEAHLQAFHYHDDDLIVEFPSFGSHPRETQMRESLQRALVMRRASPPWEKITG